jgi:hypothetical protein
MRDPAAASASLSLCRMSGRPASVGQAPAKDEQRASTTPASGRALRPGDAEADSSAATRSDVVYTGAFASDGRDDRLRA